MSDGKLERSIKTHLFLGFDFGVNNYWLWFVKPSSPNLLISRIVEFDEFAIPFEVRELVVAVKDPDVCKKVELSVETSDKIFGSIIFLVISKERRLPH